MTHESVENPLRDLFNQHQGRFISKWDHYFDVYHRYLNRFRGTECTVLEIGVFHGGSLQLWREYFGPGARIVGVDINPKCAGIVEPGCEIVIGSQSDRGFLRDLRSRLGPIDVLIDDGGHRMEQLVITFQELFGAVKSNGVYIAEDLHTSYWREYGGGYRNPASFIEFVKAHIDQLNSWYSRDAGSFVPDDFTRSVSSMHFHDSMLVIEKQIKSPPQVLIKGTPSYEDQNIESMKTWNEGINAHLKTLGKP